MVGQRPRAEKVMQFWPPRSPSLSLFLEALPTHPACVLCAVSMHLARVHKHYAYACNQNLPASGDASAEAPGSLSPRSQSEMTEYDDISVLRDRCSARRVIC